MQQGTLLALDPSSTKTGYALLRRPHGEVIEAGTLSGRAKDAAIGRAMEMADCLIKLIAEARPDSIVIETPGVHAAGNPIVKAKRAGKGLAVYGVAVGIIYRAAWQTGVEVVPISAHEWTRRVSKEKRARALQFTTASYRAVAETDRGRDVADAIEMGQWWLKRCLAHEVAMLTRR